MTEPEPLQQVGRTHVRFRGRKFSYFSGCDYFRLASHPHVLRASGAGLRRYGLNVAASRLTTGNHVLYQELEKRLTRFFGARAALLVPNGYMTNQVVTQSLAGEFSHALVDEGAHPSLKDSVRALECPVHPFKHRDIGDLTRAVRKCGRRAKILLLTDGMFSNDGSTPLLKRYLDALPAGAMMLVDDAHAAGVLGKTGKGSLEYHGVSRQRIVQTITLSKAFGVFGGAILGNRALRQRIVDRSGAFIGSTPLPLPLAAAALVSIDILAKNKDLRMRLVDNATYVKGRLLQGGLDIENTPGPIIQITRNNKAEVASLRGALLKAGIYPPYVKYPGGPPAGFFRFVISSEHTRAQLDTLVQTIVSIQREI
jgi:7-keto-8-aminopelargonate synthetase-like enzyme